ncbi:MAG TPA: cupredoxin domain-containing protein [Nitrososphaerales archaeon]|nr:cupredoxin domain-containing protein [Nitrososphaerales archaeon]
MRKGVTSTAGAGIVVSVVIIAAIASIGAFQVSEAPKVDCPGGFTSTLSQPCVYTTSSSTGPTCGKTDCVNVTIPTGAATGPGYDPDTITVYIGINATVVWTNTDATFHTVTADSNNYFDSGTMQPSNVFIFNFTTLGPGTYHYHCTFHAPMRGTVVVMPKPAA